MTFLHFPRPINAARRASLKVIPAAPKVGAECLVLVGLDTLGDSPFSAGEARSLSGGPAGTPSAEWATVLKNGMAVDVAGFCEPGSEGRLRKVLGRSGVPAVRHRAYPRVTEMVHCTPGNTRFGHRSPFSGEPAYSSARDRNASELLSGLAIEGADLHADRPAGRSATAQPASDLRTRHGQRRPPLRNRWSSRGPNP